MTSDLLCNAGAHSRRVFLQAGAAGSAMLASGILGESFFAVSARAASFPRRPFPKDAVIIDANENPLGPCSAAREAVAEIPCTARAAVQSLLGAKCASVRRIPSANSCSGTIRLTIK